jgi:hypothetical protein
MAKGSQDGPRQNGACLAHVKMVHDTCTHGHRAPASRGGTVIAVGPADQA